MHEKFRDCIMVTACLTSPPNHSVTTISRYVQLLVELHFYISWSYESLTAILTATFLYQLSHYLLTSCSY